MMPPRLRKTRLSHRRRPALRHNRRLRTLRRLFAPSSRQSARRLTACERCGFVSGRRAVVDRHRRLCAGGDTCSLSCERCAWIGDTVTMYVEHRREAHGDRITVFKCSSFKPASEAQSKHTECTSVASVATDALTLSAVDTEMAGTTDAFLPPGVALASADDDDERSLDENLRPMDGQIWLVDVDAGLTDPFHISTSKDWSTSSVIGQKATVLGGVRPEVEFRPENDKKAEGGESSLSAAGEVEPLATSGGVFRCRYCRYTNAHKWKMSSHMKASHAGRLVYRCPQCPRFVTDRRVEWCAHRSRHTGKTVFSCSECAYETTMKRNFERHQERHLAGGPRRCTICSYSSTGEGAIQRHMAEYHPPSPPPTTHNSPTTASSSVFVAESRKEVQLPTTTSTSSSLSSSSSSVLLLQASKMTSTLNGVTTAPLQGRQLPVISCDATGRWTCPVCPLSYKRPADLNRHMKQKHEVALKDFAVTRAAPVQVSDDTVSSHTISSPPERPVFSAPSSIPVSAVKIFDTPGASSSDDDVSDQPLNLSMKESPPPLSASTWSMMMLDSAVNLTVSELQQTEPLDLSMVVRPRDDEEDRSAAVRTVLGYPCNQCTYVSKRASDLRRHQLVHCSSKRYRCPHCVGDRSYKLQFDLGRHMAKVHGKVADIQHETSAMSAKSLGSAMVRSPVATGSIYGASPEVVVGRGPPGMMSAIMGNNMACPYCQYVGKSSSELERHARLHSGEKPHRCPHCSFQTVWTSDLTRHIQKAHGGTDRNVAAPPTFSPHSAETASDSTVKAAPEVDYNMNVEDGGKRSSTLSVGRTTRIGSFIADVGRRTSSGMTPKTADAETGGRCPLCPFVCDSPVAMSVHLESHENIDTLRRYVCTACGLTFADAREGGDHIESMHSDLAAGRLNWLLVEMRSSGQPRRQSTEEPVVALSGADGETVVDVDALAEQYANEVTEMFYGQESTSTAVVKAPAAAVAGAAGVRRYGVAIACRSARADRCRPFKCSQCGRRSNWRWDLKKHIRASRHPNAEVIELSAEEARRSFQADLLATADRPPPPTNKPYLCSRCGHRSNWKSDVTKHIRALHPLARIVIMDDDEATATLAEYEARVNDEKTTSKLHDDSDTKSETEQKALYNVDRQKLKRLRCSACPYRSNFRSDVGRHIRHKHRDVAANSSRPTITVMSAVEAAATLSDYIDLWTHRKITPASYGTPPDTADPTQTATVPPESDVNDGDKPAENAATGGGEESFEYVEGEDESLPWKCAACEFIDPAKQVVVEHWQRYHCTSAQKSVTDQASTSDDGAPWTIVKTEVCDSSSPQSSRKRTRPVASKSLGCDICPYRTNKLGLLTLHKTYHRPQAKNTYKCPHCPYYVCAPRLLHQHIRIHLPSTAHNGDVTSGTGSGSSSRSSAEVVTKVGMRFRCSVCPYVGRRKNDIIYHRQFHRARPSAPYRCPDCPYWVGDKRLLSQHRRVHQRAGDSQTRTLTVQSSRKQLDHWPQDGDGKGSAVASDGHGNKNDHSPSSGVVSQQAFSTSQLVNKAEMQVGGVRRSVSRTLWRCDRCPYVTAKRSQHETHRQLHGSRQRHTCRLCDYSVSGLHLLMQHVRLHHCDHQDNTNNTKQSDFAPEHSSSTLREVRPVFRCDRCPYSNSRRDHLICHARFHASDAPLRCTHCDYSVSKVHLLTQHLRVHQLTASPPDLAQNSTPKDGVHASKDQFMRSLKLTTR